MCPILAGHYGKIISYIGELAYIDLNEHSQVDVAPIDLYPELVNLS